MSTKTSLLKRIAQTAVVALAGGLLSIFVVPASNAATNTSISGSCVARANFGGVIKVNVNGDNDEYIYASQSALTRPAESSTASTAVSSAVLGVQLETSTTSTGLLLSADTMTNVATVTYIVWLDKLTNGTNSTSSGPGAATASHAADPFTTVTCTAAGAPASYALSSTSASISASESATFTITPRDSAGNTTLLNTNETITVTSGLTTAKITVGIEATNADGVRLGTYLQGGNVPSPVGTLQSPVTPARNRAGGVPANGGATNAGVDTNTAVGSSTARAIVYLGAHKADGISSGNTAQGTGLAAIYTAKDTITATGAFTVNVTNTAAATTTFTVAGTGTLGMAGSTSSSFTLTTLEYVYGTGYGAGSVAASGVRNTAVTPGFNIIQGNQLAPFNAPDRSGTAASPAAASSGVVGTADATWTVSTARTAVTVTWQLSAAGTMPVTVAAVSTTSSTPSGITLGTTNLTTTSDTVASLTFTATAPADGQSYKITWNKAANNPVTLTINYAAPKVNSTNGNVDVTPDSGRALTASTVSTQAVVRDQFRNLVDGATVLWTVTGRNATAAAVSSTTNASGIATYSFTDDGVPATTLSDTVAATATTSGAGSYNSGDSAAYTWTASLAVTTLTLTNTGAAAGTAVDGAVNFTATALGASGEALSGYPVVFTASSGAYYNSTTSTWTAYTGTNGTVTVAFEGRTAGTQTITATSGGKTATSTFLVLAGSARTISVDAATASMAAGTSKRVTATVKDVYGNAVEDQAVTVSFTGTAGRVASVNGIASSSATTDANGQVVVEVASDAATGAGTGTLTLKFTGGSTSTVALNDDGSARPARVASVTSAITITAADSSVKDAAEAASDAALEAIDAANAATDAANLAAEAADAATVAAEEARDAADAATAAVEALASEVATLIAGLKAQITTLANTVAKIAKRVRA